MTAAEQFVIRSLSTITLRVMRIDTRDLIKQGCEHCTEAEALHSLVDEEILKREAGEDGRKYVAGEE
ncbi:MAG: hypothetical protein LUE27_11005 [Clostridia bacterium]|nr:hypothetical protein [Clostridia bacterium]